MLILLYILSVFNGLDASTHHVNHTDLSNSSTNHTGVAAQVSAQVVQDDQDSIIALGIVVSLCVVGVLGMVMAVVCWVKLRSQPRQNKDSEFKSTDIKDLDTRNLRDVQLTEYEKRKQQMKELDSQQAEGPEEENGNESEDGEEMDEINVVQSEPVDEETIVNPMYHYIPQTMAH